MQALARGMQAIGQALGVIAVAVIALLSFPIFYDALARKVGVPTTWVFEVSQYALICGAFLANAYALRHGNHFRVQILLTLFPRRRQFLDDLSLAGTLLFAVVIAVCGAMTAFDSWSYGVRSASIFNVPLYLPQAVVPLGGLALALQAAAMLILRQSPSEASEFA